MRSEQEFLVDVLERLNRAGIDYMLTGSMASNYWGAPRTTHDLDFVILLNPDQVDRFTAAFERDLFIQRESVRSIFQPPYQCNVIDNQSALKADFWQLRENDFEQEMFRRRRLLTLFEVPAWIATAEDVLLHKLYWNRLTPSERHLLDAAGVFVVQAASLDLKYLEDWAEKLQVTQELDDLISGKLRPKST
jgi:hypothetical protein